MPGGEDQDYTKTFELVVSAQAGDRNALEKLFARYLPRVTKIVALRAGWRIQQLAQFEDIVQGAMLKALRGFKKFEHRSEGSFRNWLAACVQSEIASVLRQAGVKKRGSGRVVRFGDCETALLPSEIFASKEPRPSTVVQGAEMAAKFEETLVKMSKREREVIILRRLCHMSYAEIAKKLGFPAEEAARMAFSRALRKLKKMLGLRSTRLTTPGPAARSP